MFVFGRLAVTPPVLAIPQSLNVQLASRVPIARELKLVGAYRRVPNATVRERHCDAGRPPRSISSPRVPSMISCAWISYDCGTRTYGGRWGRLRRLGRANDAAGVIALLRQCLAASTGASSGTGAAGTTGATSATGTTSTGVTQGQTAGPNRSAAAAPGSQGDVGNGGCEQSGPTAHTSATNAMKNAKPCARQRRRLTKRVGRRN
jgi:hypothetical protein